ncbi:MAG: hypothetical protein FJW30_16665 [Acidobacteria bacterium]|nr:hypothetical protein [Acidobacteriota bacterium]
MALDLVVAAVARQGQGLSLIGVHGGEYIRLVAPTPDGILYQRDLRFAYPVVPRPYDRIRVSAPWLDNRPGQPESRVVGGEAWQLLERPCCQANFPLHSEPSLFGDTHGAVRASESSIQCIEPSDVQLHFIERTVPKARVTFRHRGHVYDLPLLDVHWREAVLRKWPGSFGLEEVGCRAPFGLRFIAGLGEPWKGWRYKMVLGIVPLRGGPKTPKLGPRANE